MNRLILVLVGMMIVDARSTWGAELGPVDPQAGLGSMYAADACWPLPLSYPRGWEIVIHTPCPPGYYLPRRFNYDHYAGRGVAHFYGPVNRRPYLRPGWWW
jgi:hypothetical protein